MRKPSSACLTLFAAVAFACAWFCAQPFVFAQTEEPVFNDLPEAVKNSPPLTAADMPAALELLALAVDDAPRREIADAAQRHGISNDHAMVLIMKLITGEELIREPPAPGDPPQDPSDNPITLTAEELEVVRANLSAIQQALQ
ncbi:MAG: hypothetical protein LBW85_10425 [Deltaproteobacteria bacterium]|jgi:hypothetical protein|nr:hypothetical protein [Deltaproteobacteria bacterium]